MLVALLLWLSWVRLLSLLLAVSPWGSSGGFLSMVRALVRGYFELGRGCAVYLWRDSTLEGLW